MDYFEFETLVEDEGNDKYLILIIYDISDNKHRLKISKLLEGYGTRIQKSAFEAWLTKKHFEKLLHFHKLWKLQLYIHVRDEQTLHFCLFQCN